MPSSQAETKVWGSGVYSDASSICQTAIHSGAISRHAEGGTETSQAVVAVGAFISDWLPTASPDAMYNYKSTTQNGITSKSGYATVSSRSKLFRVQRGSTLPPNYDLISIDRTKPSLVSGFGVVQLNTAATLASSGRQYPFGNATHSSRRAAVLADARQMSGLTTSSFSSRCFYVSHDMPALRDADGFDEGSDQVKVTLAWTDPPASPSFSTALINDLDLHVFGPRGEEYRGNLQIDRLNNVEQVTLTPSESSEGGMYCAVVNAYSVPYGPQPYSLVVSGRGVTDCIEPAGANLPALGGVWELTFNSCPQSLINSNAARAASPGAPRPIFTLFQAGHCLSIRAQPSYPNRSFFGLRQSTSGSQQVKFPAQTQFALSGGLERVNNELKISLISEGDRSERLIGKLVPVSEALGDNLPHGSAAMILQSLAGCRASLVRTSSSASVQNQLLFDVVNNFTLPTRDDVAHALGDAAAASSALQPPIPSISLLIVLCFVVVVGSSVLSNLSPNQFKQ